MTKTTFFEFVEMHNQAVKDKGIGVYSVDTLKYYQEQAAIGKVYEIDEESFDYMLGVMPPIRRNGAYMLQELIIGNVGYQFKEKDGRFCIWLGFAN